MILSINTSTPQFGIALMDEDGTILAEYFMSKEKGFGSFMPALHFLISKLHADIHDLSAIAVAIGPGSFTGLRVGLSAAKGLCHGLQIPIIGISSLEALASQIMYYHLPITPILYSRKNELFIARFIQNNDAELIRDMEDMAVKIDDLPSTFKTPSLFIGNDFSTQGPIIKKVLGFIAHLAPADCWNLKASAVGTLGLKRFHAHNFDEPQNLDPLYLRSPDIRPNPFPLLSEVQGSGNTEKQNADQPGP